MSCGSATCNPTIQNDLTRDLGTATRASRLSRAIAGLARMFDNVRRRQVWIEFEKVRQRRILLELDDRLLADIGITREQAVREAQKLFRK